MQSGCQNWTSWWRSRVGTVNLGVVQRRAPPCSCFTRRLWAAQPSDPARCKTIEAAATAAVSARRIRGPSDTLRHPRSLAAAASSLLMPPSGPISSETVSESANWSPKPESFPRASSHASSRWPAPGPGPPPIPADSQELVTGRGGSVLLPRE